MVDRTLLISCTIFLILLVRVAAQIQDSDIFVNNTRKVLTRKKRFLIFPEGSSLQLVYCLVLPVSGQSYIFTMGWTASLAWELPHEPFKIFRKKSKLLNRIDDAGSKTSGGWTVSKKKASTSDKFKKTHYDPFRIKHPPTYNTSGHLKIPQYHTINYDMKKRIQDYQRWGNKWSNAKTNNYYSTTNKFSNYGQGVSSYKNPAYTDIHRRTRRDLFSRIENFFTAQRKYGKACLLKSICEVAQTPPEAGTFTEEIIKAIFRVKPHVSVDGIKDEYDSVAHLASKPHFNCKQQYPECESSVWHIF